jgi:hypothetical protein
MRRLTRRDEGVALGGLLLGGAIASLIAAAVWPAGGATASKPATTATPSATPATPSATEPLDLPFREKEIALPAPPQGPYKSGHILLTPLRMTCGLSEIVGTHAEWFAQGQICYVRVAISNNEAFTHTFDAAKTALTTTAGASIGYSAEAQQIKRQPESIAQLGAHDRYEIDIYFDVPRDATVNGFTFSDSEGGPVITVPLPVRTWPFA